MLLTFEVDKALIVRDRYGPDHVSLRTARKSPTPGLTQEPLELCFKVAADGGEEYLLNVIGVEPELIEVIDTGTPAYEFGRKRP